MEGLSSPYDAPELYDMVLDGLAFDVPFWIAEARTAKGPALEVGCGTGRLMLRMLEAGIDIDGLDASGPMLGRLREKATARNLAPRVVEADMRDFTMPRRYALVFVAFNGFGHCLTTDDQIRTLRCCREHLEPGGRFLLHISYPGVAYWSQPAGKPVMEIEVPHPVTQLPVRMYDTRTMDRVGQQQHSLVDIQELDAEGRVIRSSRSETRQRWVYRFELELLFRTAGFTRSEIFGGFEGEPLERDDQQMIARAWKD